jgi:hypothetical protein
MMQARQMAAANLAVEAHKAAYEVAQKEAIEKEAAKSRVEQYPHLTISQNSIAHSTTVNSTEIQSE